MDRSGLSVRPLGDDEWPLLRSLRLAAVADTPEAFLVHPERERPDVDDDWCTYLRSGTWLVAEADGKVAGMLCVVVEPGTGQRYVEAMWVAPQYRRRHAGASLLAAAADVTAAANRGEISLWVLDGNDGARDFYLRQGFTPTGRSQPIGTDPVRIEEEFRRVVTPGAFRDDTSHCIIR